MRSLFISLLYLFILIDCSAQYSISLSKKEIIKKALDDEIARCYNELNHPKAGKPFYIQFYIQDATKLTALATLGAIQASEIVPAMDWSSRLMMGDYQFNDENFQNSFEYGSEYSPSIDLPQDADYWGFRRAIWLSLENIFNSASANYVEKKSFFAENPPTEPLLADYTPLKAFNLTLTDTVPNLLLHDAEEYVRSLSNVFKLYPSVTNSSVSIEFTKGTIFLSSTEGVRVELPFSIGNLEVAGQITSISGEKYGIGGSIYFKNPTALPSLEQVSKSIAYTYQQINNLKDAEDLQEKYTGPVLFYGEPLANIVNNILFSGEDALIAERKPTENTPSYRKNSQIRKKLISNKIGKKILPSEYSVILKPHLQTYMNKPLVGYTPVDAEGVVPPHELVLIEQGVLKAVLSSRVPTENVSSSNGHNRFLISNGELSKDLAPSNVFITSTQPKDYTTLKQELIDEAIRQNLEYAIICKSIDTTFDQGNLAYYKVSLVDGSENLIKPLNIDQQEIGANRLKGCMNKTFVSNLISGQYNYSFGQSECSMILPLAMIVDNVTLIPQEQGFDKPFIYEE
jgi:hypothetical protein